MSSNNFSSEILFLDDIEENFIPLKRDKIIDWF